MPQTTSRQKPLFKTGLPQLEVEQDAIYPEKRLWIAIVLFTIWEYEEQLRQIRKLWESSHRKVSRHLQLELRRTRHEVQHEWFETVCDNADIDQSHIVSKLKDLEEKYRLQEIEFSDEDTQVTRVQIRKALKRMRYA